MQVLRFPVMHLSFRIFQYCIIALQSVLCGPACSGRQGLKWKSRGGGNFRFAALVGGNGPCRLEWVFQDFEVQDALEVDNGFIMRPVTFNHCGSCIFSTVFLFSAYLTMLTMLKACPSVRQSVRPSICPSHS